MRSFTPPSLEFFQDFTSPRPATS